ncbi:MAG: recombinase RecA [Acidobacteria bacterium]|nr:MAG: recombinase RecA [Acidobacteriota bacterium]
MSTGVAGLDEILNGGLIPCRTYLIVGATGTGKTILSLQWLLDGLQQGERGLYITLAESASDIRQNARSLGWNIDDIEIIDLAPGREMKDAIASEYSVFPPSEVERIPIWRAIYSAVEEKRPRRLAIDSATQLRHLSSDEYQFRKHMLGMVRFLNESQCTSLLTFEPTELERETSVALAVDGIIRLRRDISRGRVIGLRSVQVEKFRGSDFISGLHPLRITSRGLVVFPHRIESPGGTRPGSETLSSGIRQLDELLAGGLESATTTIISGPTGIGKSTLGMQFLTQAAASGKRTALYTFEESVESILARSRGLGMPVDTLQEAGALTIIGIDPMQLYPDEFLAVVRAGIEQQNHRVIMLDSLRGYQLAMEEFGTLVAHIQNLTHYCTQCGVTTLLINEVEHVTGDLIPTELGISYLADNIILLRYAESFGRIIRVVGCLKKRLSSYQPELRQFRITDEGIWVGDRLANLQGLLTGVPMSEKSEHD